MARTKKEKKSSAATPSDTKKRAADDAEVAPAVVVDPAENEMTEENMTTDIDYLAIFNSEMMPWFMEGVRGLLQTTTSFPEKSTAADRTLARIHRAHPHIAFGYVDVVGKKQVVNSYPMVSYESAGLWLDDAGEPCLVVKALFEDDEEPMLLLYKSNLVETEQDIVKECQWCVLKEGSKKKAKAKK